MSQYFLLCCSLPTRLTHFSLDYSDWILIWRCVWWPRTAGSPAILRGMLRVAHAPANHHHLCSMSTSWWRPQSAPHQVSPPVSSRLSGRHACCAATRNTFQSNYITHKIWLICFWRRRNRYFDNNFCFRRRARRLLRHSAAYNFLPVQCELTKDITYYR